jgi:hypothetical protein
MLTILSPLIGIIGSLLPSVVRIFERRQEMKHEIELTRVKIEASIQQAKVQLDIENVKADVEEGKSVRSHDRSIDGGKYINTLRASIRPVITYCFFFLFVAVKIAAAWTMIANGQSVPDMLKAVWDPETMALFSTIIAFWFGSRVIEKMDERVVQRSYNVTPINTKTNK